MTFKEFANEVLNDWSEEQRNCDLTVYVRGIDEFYPVSEVKFTPADEPADVLDPNHPYLEI